MGNISKKDEISGADKAEKFYDTFYPNGSGTISGRSLRNPGLPTSWKEIMESRYSDVYLSPMALIYPRYNEERNPKIRFHVCIVQAGEGIEPHVHVYLDDDSNGNAAYVCLASATYAPYHKDGAKLNAEQKDALITFFNTMRKGTATKDKNGNFVPCNCWQEAVDLWISTYGLTKKDPFTYDKDGNPVMPDYGKLD